MHLNFLLTEMNCQFKITKNNTRLHTIESKLKVIKYAEKHNKSSEAIHFDLPRTTINDWVKNKSKYLALPQNKLNKYLYIYVEIIVSRIRKKIFYFLLNLIGSLIKK